MKESTKAGIWFIETTAVLMTEPEVSSIYRPGGTPKQACLPTGDLL